jgi:exodeoxyribonuclease-1
MANSMYWYDFETTGINPGRDRAIQFAGVRTDEDLNVIGEPLDLLCYPGEDTIPAPEAILVTGINMMQLKSSGMNEAEFSRQIHEQFSTPETCVVGFNSLRFDDEFTRYLFYRNFYDPYAREWQSGNSRWDVIDMFRMAHALRPEGINWPVAENGNVTFRLEKLTEENGIGHENAHDAVSDVLATIGMAKKLKDSQPKLYAYLFALRNKNEVLKQLYPLGKTPIVHVSSMYPASQGCVAVVLPLCVHPTNSNGVICFDLSNDPTDLIELSPVELHRRIFTARQDLGNEKRVALKTIHINKCPAIAPLSTLQGNEVRLHIDMPAIQLNMRRIQQSSGVVEKISEAFSLKTFPPTNDPDLMLYQGGFFSSDDKSIMSDIHTSKPENLAAYGAHFTDSRLSEMLLRYRARNFPESLSDDDRDYWKNYCSTMQKGENGLQAQLARIEALKSQGHSDACLQDLHDYLLSIQQA